VRSDKSVDVSQEKKRAAKKPWEGLACTLYGKCMPTKRKKYEVKKLCYVTASTFATLALRAIGDGLLRLGAIILQQ
jgi:hypothetical protein